MERRVWRGGREGKTARKGEGTGTAGEKTGWWALHDLPASPIRPTSLSFHIPSCAYQLCQNRWRPSFAPLALKNVCHASLRRT
eukprot:1518679-Rhodomonas_salina.1